MHKTIVALLGLMFVCGGVSEVSAQSRGVALDARTSISGEVDSSAVQVNVDASVGADVVACTMDAHQCPNGDWVGRTGPQCEFVCSDEGLVKEGRGDTHTQDESSPKGEVGVHATGSMSGTSDIRGVVQGRGVGKLGEVRINAVEVRGWNPETKAAVQARLEANDAKNTANDFGLMVALKATAHERVTGVVITEKVSADASPVVTLTYKAEKRIFGLFKKEVDATVTVDAKGEAKVTYATSLFNRIFGFGGDTKTYISLAQEIQADARIAGGVQ